MAKRFTDSLKWRNGWFRKLSNKHKILWLYLLDYCESGFIKIDIDLIYDDLKNKYSLDEIINTMAGRLIHIKKNLYFIPKFIQFQYPKGLNENNNAHKPVINELKIHNIEWEYENLKFIYKINNIVAPSEDLARSSLGAQEKDKDKDKYKYKNKDNISNSNNNGTGKIKKDAIEILCHLNKLAKRNFSSVEATITPIMSRLKEGYSKDDLARVIWYKTNIDNYFIENPKYLNPMTLFRASKFPLYLEEVNTHDSKIGTN